MTTTREDDDNKITVNREVPFSWLVSTVCALVVLGVGTIFSAGMQLKAYQTLTETVIELKGDQKVIQEFISSKNIGDARRDELILGLDRRVTVIENRP